MKKIAKSIVFSLVLLLLIAGLIACGGDKTDYVYLSYSNGRDYTVQPGGEVFNGKMQAEKNKEYRFSIQVGEGYDVTTLVVKLNGNNINGILHANTTDTMDYTITLSDDAALTVSEPTLLYMDIRFSDTAPDGDHYNKHYSDLYISYTSPKTGVEVNRSLGEEVLSSGGVSVPYGLSFTFAIYSGDSARFEGKDVRVTVYAEGTETEEFVPCKSTVAETLAGVFEFAPRNNYRVVFNTDYVVPAEYELSERSTVETELISMELVGKTYEDTKILHIYLEKYQENPALYQNITVNIGEETVFTMNPGTVLQNDGRDYIAVTLTKRSPAHYSGVRDGRLFDVYIGGIQPPSAYFRRVTLGFDEMEYFHIGQDGRYGTTKPYHIAYNLTNKVKQVYYHADADIIVMALLPQKYDYASAQLNFNSSLSIAGNNLQKLVRSEEGSDDAKWINGTIVLERMFFVGDNPDYDEYAFIKMNLSPDRDYTLYLRGTTLRKVQVELLFSGITVAATAVQNPKEGDFAKIENGKIFTVTYGETVSFRFVTEEGITYNVLWNGLAPKEYTTVATDGKTWRGYVLSTTLMYADKIFIELSKM